MAQENMILSYWLCSSSVQRTCQYDAEPWGVLGLRMMVASGPVTVRLRSLSYLGTLAGRDRSQA